MDGLGLQSSYDWRFLGLITDIIDEIMEEFGRAINLHPAFPTDPVHQCAIMAEEAGEAIRACNDMAHEGGGRLEYETELMQTAAMCIRCLLAIRR